jgi:hypothetical protein
MNIKSITSLALAAAAVAFVSVAPAQANNNNKYLNQLAMQMYMQNQATAATTAYNPYAYGNNIYGNNIYGNNAYGYAANVPTPWSAGAIPAAYPVVSPYANVYSGYRAPVYHHRHHW